MDSEVIVHLGLHKTATTFLQQEVFPKLDGVTFYPRIGIENINVPRIGKVLISDEALSGHPFLENTVELRNDRARAIHKCFPDARIIIGLRKKDQWLRSLYCEYVKSGGVYDFDDFQCKVIDQPYLDFEGYIALLRGLFPQVYIYNYEDLIADPKAFVGNLCAFIGVPSPHFRNVVYNRRLTDKELKIGIFLNKHMPLGLNPLSHRFLFRRQLIFLLRMMK